MQNLHHIFHQQYIGQIYGGDFAKFCGLLRIYELYLGKNQSFLSLIFNASFLRAFIQLLEDSGLSSLGVPPDFGRNQGGKIILAKFKIGLSNLFSTK